MLESKKKKTKKATGASEGGNGSDTLKTFIDSIIMKVEDSDVKIKRTRSARKPEERRDDDPKQKLSKHVNKYFLFSSKVQIGKLVGFYLESTIDRLRDCGAVEQF